VEETAQSFYTDGVFSRRIFVMAMSCSEKEHPRPSSGASQFEGCDVFSRFQGVLNKLGRVGPAKDRTNDFLHYVRSLPRDQVPAHLLRWSVSIGLCADRVQVQALPAEDRTSLLTRWCRHHLACQACAIQRGARELSRALQRLSLVEPSQLRYYMLTMTVANGPDLAERYGHLHRSLAAMQRRARRCRGDSCFRFFAGGMSSFEFKIGSGSGLWHPHVHMLVASEFDLLPSLVKSGDCASGYTYHWPELAAEWRAVTGDSFIHEIHPVRCSDETGFFGALLEVFKYAVKVNENGSHAEHLEAVRVLHGRRLLSTFGVFYRLGLDSEPRRAERRASRLTAATPGVQVFDYGFVPGGGRYDLLSFHVAAGASPSAASDGSWDLVKECAYVEEVFRSGSGSAVAGSAEGA
jgi:hypothetical protein